MVKARMLRVTQLGGGRTGYVGDVVEISEDDAPLFFRTGKAVPVSDEETATAEPPRTAAKPRPRRRKAAS